MLKNKRNRIIKMLAGLTMACLMLVVFFSFSAPAVSAEGITLKEPVYSVNCMRDVAIRSVGGGKVMTSMFKTNKVEHWTLGSAGKETSQIWYLDCLGDGYNWIYTINSADGASRKYLTSPESDKNNVNVTMEAMLSPKEAEARQLWKLIDCETYFKIRAKNREGTSMCLTVEDIIFNPNGAYVRQSTKDNSRARWTMEYYSPSTTQSH